MAKAVKTASGKWKCRSYNKVLGKQKQFTADTKKEAERLAAVYAGETRQMVVNRTVFLQAAESYIDNREAVLSPGTIREYRRMLYTNLADLHSRQVAAITSEELQAWVNRQAAYQSPKTVRCEFAFITAVIHSVVPAAAFSVDLPKKVRQGIKMPSEDDIQRLLAAVEGTDMEVPILLALFGPMRRGEICALDADHVNGNTVHVQYALAQNEAGRWVKKAPKTFAGDRYIEFPDFVIEKLPKEGPVTNLTPNSITTRMPRIMKKLGMDYTFHQLRHWSVSYLHKHGLSDQEILDRAGWESTGIFKEVYRHSLKGKDRAVEMFSKLAQH